MRNKFFEFLDKLEMAENVYLIESVKSGYDIINENIVLTPLPMARLTGMDDDATVKSPSGKWSKKPNSENEYFDQTLPDAMLDIADTAYIGSRIGAYPKPGRTHLGASGDKHLSGNWGDSSAEGDNYAGSSGGYNLGGPSNAG
jgi:hypothetical protein